MEGRHINGRWTLVTSVLNRCSRARWCHAKDTSRAIRGNNGLDECEERKQVEERNRGEESDALGDERACVAGC